MKILLVEDEGVPRQAIRVALEAEGYQVETAVNGQEGIDLFLKNGADLILSDIRMPIMNGIEMLVQIKHYRPVPVVLMTGFSEMCDAVEALELGAVGFLAKPFKLNELLELIKSLSPEDENIELNAKDSEFCKLPIEDFITGSEVKYDIYIRISSSKYLKIAHQGEDIEMDRINSYKKKGLDFLYLKKEHFIAYMGFNILLGQNVAKKSNISQSKKIHLMKHTGDIISRYVHSEGIDKQAYQNSRLFIESTISVLMENESAYNLLDIMGQHSDYLYSHSIGVSMMSVMIARKIGWSSHPTLFKLAMGGLFHDIGEKDIDPVVISKMRKDQSVSEVKMIETHPMRGVQILTEIKVVPSDVIQIVFQHHENCLGQGYPSRLNRYKIFPMAKLVSVADEFCDMAYKNTADGEKTLPHDVVKRMKETGIGRLETQFMDALDQLVEPCQSSWSI